MEIIQNVMTSFFNLVILIIWLAGACVRAYRLARFYQIEEYMSLRFLRWLFAARDRWLPARASAAWLIGAGLGFALSESPAGVLPVIIGGVTALVAVYPAREGEIKKAFKATPRARRMLGGAFALLTLGAVVSLVIANAIPLDRYRPLVVGAFGFALFLGAPLALIGGNLLMQPVEALFRRRFIAQARRALASVNPLVIGITGSYGKTSTKTYLAHILNGRYRAYPTPKSYNTLMGVCIAINNDLAQDHSIEYFIAEMGAYIPGEIARIAELTKPQIAIVIEVGPQHLERFGTLENVAIAKYEIIKALPSDGVGVFNYDNPYVREMFMRSHPDTRIAVSRALTTEAARAAGVRLIAVDATESLEGLRFTMIDMHSDVRAVFTTPLLGEHNITNILLAAAVALHEGMSLSEIAQRARTLQPAESRLVTQTDAQGIIIINDAYSANPVGVISALRVLSLHQTGRRVLITPGMVELGALMEAENHKLGAIAAQHATDVILVGAQLTAPIRAGLLDAGFAPDRVQTVATVADGMSWYRRNLTAGDVVLFLNDLPDTYST